MTEVLLKLIADIEACRLCERELSHGVRPILRVGGSARLCLAGQAPGLRVHKSGLPYDDASGERLRGWLAICRDAFYDQSRIAIIPMGFCFPGYDEAGADKPPRRECVRTWHNRLFAAAPKFALILAIGAHAQRIHLKGSVKKTVTETVRCWREYDPFVIPLPHPSWHNIAWLKKNPWFERELIPYLRARVAQILAD